MKKAILLALTVVSMAPAAFADGFICQTEDRTLNVTVYNHTQPTAGTRNAAVMVLSDPRVSNGRRTIAKFTSVKRTLSNSAAQYLAKVDLRVSESNRAGEYVAGTRLGFIDSLVLDVAFRYGRQGNAAGQYHPAQVTVVMRNGQTNELSASCVRYLKN